MEQLGFWGKITEHPAYDSFWQQQAMDRVLAAQPLQVPTLLVHSLYDAEDIYGAIAVWKALKSKDATGGRVFLAMGPWNHGGEIHDGSSLGPLRFDQDTGLQFRRDILKPFLDQHLKGGPKADIAPVSAFETGTNAWRRLPGWPLAGVGTATAATPYYLAAGQKVTTAAP